MSCVIDYGVECNVFFVSKAGPRNSCLSIASSVLDIHSHVCAAVCSVVLRQVCEALLKTRSGLIWVKKRVFF